MDDSTQNFTEAWHKSLAAKRLEYMKKESYYATLRRDVEKTIVLSHIHGNPCYDANSVSGLGLIQDGYGTVFFLDPETEEFFKIHSLPIGPG